MGMHDVYLGQRNAEIVPVDQLAASHGIGAGAARMYTRFFGQTAVRLCDVSHRDLLADALSGLVSRHPDLRGQKGVGVYTKTQTHNTFFETDWLPGLFADVGLGHWETLTFSMTNCASGLAAVHFAASLGQPFLGQPFILLSGEKAFHAAGNRLSVGLLGEAGVAVLFTPGGRYRLRGTDVTHLPRYHINPDDMAADDRKALQTEFESGLVEFLCGIVAADPAFFDRGPVVVPYNLNAPLIARAVQAAGLDRNLAPGTDTRIGHMFCSDNYLSVARCMPAEDASVFLFSAGHGVTFAAMKLEPAHSN